jgi:hypothetical protein
MLTHKLNRESKAPAQNCKNRTIQFQKSDSLILSILVAIKGATGVNGGALPLCKWHLDDREGGPRHAQGFYKI